MRQRYATVVSACALLCQLIGQSWNLALTLDSSTEIILQAGQVRAPLAHTTRCGMHGESELKTHKKQFARAPSRQSVG